MRFQMLRISMLLIFLTFFLTACDLMRDPPLVVQRDMPQVGLMQEMRAMKLGKIAVRVPRGKKIGGLYDDISCYKIAEIKWNQSGTVSIDPTLFKDVFREDMIGAGFNIAGNPDQLFDQLDSNEAELIVGALVKDVEINICTPISAFYIEEIKGWCYVKVNWQFFSSVEQRIVYQTTTEGVFHQEKHTDDIDQLDMWQNAFSAATQNLMAEPGFLKLVSGTDYTELKSNRWDKPVVVNNVRPYSSPIADNMVSVRDAAVLVHVGVAGHGSGFFIDPKGYILTNRHVTGGVERILVEMTTGRKMIAEVIRSDIKRDIALLKVEDGAYPALPIEGLEPQVGDEVYAIGAPMLKKLKFTVSKGIVSSYRERYGLPMLQSDVNTQGGNSGGPLVNDKGNVVAVCVRGYNGPDGTGWGANLFIPIHSALKALNVRLKNKVR